MVLENIKNKIFNSEDTCQAVVEDKNNRTCSNTQFGRGTTEQGYEVKYCRKHIPSAAIMGGRINPVKFYIPEEDIYITVE